MSCAIERGEFPDWKGKSSISGDEESPVTTATPLEKYLAAHPGKPRSPRMKLRILTPRQVARLRRPGANLHELARRFKISMTGAWKIRHRITYRDLP